MRRSVVVVFLAASSSAATACSLLTTFDGLSSDAPDDAAEASVEATTPADATDDAADAGKDVANDAPPEAGPEDAGDDAGGPDLHPRGTFETGSCEPWISYHGTLAPSAAAHGGGGSCRVCTLPTTTDFYTADDTGAAGPATLGAVYRASVWARTDPTAAAPAPLRLFLRSFTVVGGTFTALEQSVTPDTDIDAQWKRIEVTMPITKAGGTLNVYVGSEHRMGACFFLDDVVLQRID